AFHPAAGDSGPERLGSLVQRLLPGQANVLEKVWIISEFAERRALPVPRPSPAQCGPPEPNGLAPICLMKSKGRRGRLGIRGRHRQAPRVVKLLLGAFQ